MKNRLLVLMFLALGTSIYAQVVPNVDWVRNYSERDQIENVPSAIDANNNVYVTGYTVFGGTRDFTTIKYDASGTLQWVQHYNNIPGGDDRSNAVVVDANGNIYVTGQSQGTGTGFDYATIKYNANGVQQWVARYDGTASSDDIAVAIAVDNSGNVYVTGRSRGTSSFMDYATVKYNSSGVQQWVSRYNGTANGDDGAVAIALGTGNRVYVTGTARMTGTGNDAVTIRYNANNGNQMWAAATNGTNNGSDAGYAILADGNNVVVCGMVGNTSTHEDYFLYKFNGNNGNVQIQKTYDGYGLSDYATGLVMDSQGNYVITGVSRNISSMEYHTVKFNSSGIQQWVNKRVLNQSFTQVSPKVAVDFVDHFYVCGEINISNNIDMLLYQITPGGNTTWSETHNGTQNGNDVAVDLVMGNFGVIYLAGQTQNSNAKFDYTTIRYSQTPVVFPPDFDQELSSTTYSYYKNEGQIINTSGNLEPTILYHTDHTFPLQYIKQSSTSFVFPKIDTIPTTPDTLNRIDMTFLDANPLTKIYSFEGTGQYNNYYLAHCPQGITNIEGSKRLMTPNLWNLIDLHYYSNDLGLKYYFVVKPTGDPNKIRLSFTGSNSISTGSNGELLVACDLGVLKQLRPIVYQVNFSGNIVPVGFTPAYSVNGNVVSITFGNYNPAFPLIIEIKGADEFGTRAANGNLYWSTYYGGSSIDPLYDVANNSIGDANVTGIAWSTNYPTTNAYQGTNAGNQDVTVASFSNNGVRKWSTYFGGSESDGSTAPHGLVVDSQDNIYIASISFSQNLPMLDPGGNIFDNVNDCISAPCRDVFIAKFSINGGLLWSTYYGGTDPFATPTNDQAYDIAIDNNDNLYVCGTMGTNITLTNPAFTSSGYGFIVKFTTNGNILMSTRFGTAFNTDIIRSITCDANGNLIGTGVTTSTSGLQITNAAQATYAGGASDAFVFKLSPTGSIVFFTYLGGNMRDQGLCVKTDYLNNIFIAGYTASQTTFPVINQGGTFYDGTYNGAGINFSTVYPDMEEGIFCKYSPTGSLVHSTFYGGQANDAATSIAVDNFGNIFLCGITASDNLTFPSPNLANAFEQLNHADGNDNDGDCFLLGIDNNMNLKWTTYFGGDNGGITTGDLSYSLSLYQNAQLFMVGATGSTTNFPLVDLGNGAEWQPSNQGIINGFISRFDVYTTPVFVEQHDLNYPSLFLYPNPSSDIINLVIPDGNTSSGNIIIYDNLGRIIYTNNYSNVSVINLDIKRWENGIYFVRVENDKNTYTSRFQIIR